MHLLLNRFFELALGEVHRYEGTINQFLGDGFMALFGAPIAHEDHARRAVLAALGVQQAARGRSRNDLAEQSGDGASRSAWGSTPAGWWWAASATTCGWTTRRWGTPPTSRPASSRSRSPARILVSEATSRMLQGAVRFEALPPFQVKGKTEPIQAFQVLGLGRQSEQAVLAAAAFRRSSAASGSWGCSRSCASRPRRGRGRWWASPARRARASRASSTSSGAALGSGPRHLLNGRCLSYGSGIPYLPLLHMLPQRVGDQRRRTTRRRRRQGPGPPQQAGLDAGEPLPYLLRLLGVKAGTEGLADLSPQALQARTFAILRQMILNAGQGGLVVLEIEDLHWVDETSEEFLAYLVEGLAAARILLLLTYRSGYLPRWLEKSYATQITLRRLTRAGQPGGGRRRPAARPSFPRSWPAPSWTRRRGTRSSWRS